MKIFMLEIPVTNYYRDGVYYKTMFFKNHSPKKEEVLEILKKDLADADPKDDHYGFIDEVKEAIKVLESAEEFPMLGGNLIMTNTRVMHPKWGDQPLAVRKIFVNELN